MSTFNDYSNRTRPGTYKRLRDSSKVSLLLSTNYVDVLSCVGKTVGIGKVLKVIA
jgi:hypothetical protein